MNGSPNLIITCWKWRSSGFPWSQCKKRQTCRTKKRFFFLFLTFFHSVLYDLDRKLGETRPCISTSLDVYSGPYYELTGQRNLNPVAGKRSGRASWACSSALIDFMHVRKNSFRPQAHCFSFNANRDPCSQSHSLSAHPVTLYMKNVYLWK